MKKLLSVIAAGALISSVFSVGAAQAADPTPIPAELLIVDPLNDSNYLNDGNTFGTPAGGAVGKNNVTPADVGSVSDILGVWMTSDADSVSAHFQTQAAGPATQALFFRVRVDPGAGAACMWFQGYSPGAGSVAGTPVSAPAGGASLRQVAPCATVATVSEGATFTQEAGPDGTGIHTIDIPKALDPALADGTALASISAEVTNYSMALTSPTLDNTTIAEVPYVIGSGGGPAGPPAAEEPKEEKPDKPKGCKKGKKKCPKGPKGPKPGSCATYTPGEEGAEAETLSVTDAHTAEAPLEIKIEQEMGLGGPLLNGLPPDQTSHVFKNLQVDAAAAEAGLYIRYEFPVYEDHDLYVNYPDGTEAAHVGGFNAVSAGPLDGTGSGGHSERGAEQLDGLRTPDCGGYTVDFSNYLGEGGEYTITMWLGEIQNDPAAPAKAVK